MTVNNVLVKNSSSYDMTVVERLQVLEIVPLLIGTVLRWVLIGN